MEKSENPTFSAPVPKKLGRPKGSKNKPAKKWLIRDWSAMGKLSVEARRHKKEAKDISLVDPIKLALAKSNKVNKLAAKLVDLGIEGSESAIKTLLSYVEGHPREMEKKAESDFPWHVELMPSLCTKCGAELKNDEDSQKTDVVPGTAESV